MPTRDEKNFDPNSLKGKTHEIIFEANTFWGKTFDVSLLILIVISIAVLMLESVDAYNILYYKYFYYIEWVLTILFSIEYAARLYAVKKPMKYATSFYGVIDLLAILPTYLEFFIVGTHFFMVLRVMRLLRIFRIFKLVQFLNERNTLAYSLRRSWPKISYFLFFLLLTVCVIGTLIYLIEGGNPSSSFENIPVSIYWAIVTLTTVGYGDITPITPLGQFLASAIMIMGYSIIAVPTGIISAEIARHKSGDDLEILVCQYCSEETHLPNAEFCHQCGHPL
ncbi:ion transporter [Weeksellaceae bacterium KMM 9713]|uniref:Ion transporter n=1 Tax=Profundicola chukchiensis TaxID=2961959 RepID=A0A9X4N465_9FLAO|nr:ion transporter [Profundicola chukchiensis]MDG4946689.1 ion transporter [Profundicola chukchiensis]MDG4949828.1 ion transporter [Profundicola chukchiensis]